jgi:hypothetical protein
MDQNRGSETKHLGHVNLIHDKVISDNWRKDQPFGGKMLEWSMHINEIKSDHNFALYLKISFGGRKS